MPTDSSWRCPLCGVKAENGAAHLRAEHALDTSRQDRLGLRHSIQRGDGRGPSGLRRAARRPTPFRGEEAEVVPARVEPLPADAEILRLRCDDLDGRDAGAIQARLADLPGIEGVTIDLYERTVDLFIDPTRALPPHIVAMATERVGLSVSGAELHRRPSINSRLDDETRLQVLL